MKKTVFITGGQGFLSQLLSSYLSSKGYQVDSEFVDILDFTALKKKFSSKKWDYIFHFAGLSSVQDCELDPSKAYQINLTGTALVLDAIRVSCPGAFLVFPSSAHVYYGNKEVLHSSIPIDEEQKIYPTNIYSSTKIMAESIVKDASSIWGLRGAILRLFNHTHKTQSDKFLLPSVYQQISHVKSGESISIQCGNLDLIRDLSSIFDFQRSILSLIESSDKISRIEIFNVCSGYSMNLRTVVQSLGQHLKIHLDIQLDGSKVRPGEPYFVVGSNAKLTQWTGWKPHCVNEKDLVEDFLRDT